MDTLVGNSALMYLITLILFYYLNRILIDSHKNGDKTYLKVMVTILILSIVLMFFTSFTTISIAYTVCSLISIFMIFIMADRE